MERNWFTRIALVVGCLLAVGCATVPETGRTQINFISPAYEFSLGKAVFADVKRQYTASRDTNAIAMVTKVGRRIASVANLPRAEWEFVLFESPEVNAFCLPGGKIGVFSGILKLTKDEAGLAAVLGHEVAHAVAHHGAERMSQGMLIGLAGAGVEAALSKRASSRTAATAAAAFGIGMLIGIELPHSRANESEADRIGLLYMARAGYDPSEAVNFWQRMAEQDKGSKSGPWFLRTHPVGEQRIEDLKKWMPEARLQYRPRADEVK